MSNHSVTHTGSESPDAGCTDRVGELLDAVFATATATGATLDRLPTESLQREAAVATSIAAVDRSNRRRFWRRKRTRLPATTPDDVLTLLRDWPRDEAAVLLSRWRTEKAIANMPADTGPDCTCGHESETHLYDPSGSGLTPCMSGTDHTAPVCHCREYEPTEVSA